MNVFSGLGVVCALYICSSLSCSVMSTTAEPKTIFAEPIVLPAPKELSVSPAKLEMFDNRDCAGDGFMVNFYAPGTDKKQKYTLEHTGGGGPRVCCIKTENVSISGTFSSSGGTLLKETAFSMHGNETKQPKFASTGGGGFGIENTCPDNWNFQVGIIN